MLTSSKEGAQTTVSLIRTQIKLGMSKVKNTFPIDSIKEVLSSSALKGVLPNVYHVDGMIFAVAAAPEIPMPEQWMPWLVQPKDNTLLKDDVDELADALMNGLRAHLDAMRKQLPPLPLSLLEPDESHGNIRPSHELVHWLNGLLQVHKQLEPIWHEAWQKLEQQRNECSDKESPVARLSRCLKLFTTLANVDLALKYRSEEQAEQLESNLALLINQLLSLLNDYTALAGELAEALPNQFETFTQPRQ